MLFYQHIHVFTNQKALLSLTVQNFIGLVLHTHAWLNQWSYDGILFLAMSPPQRSEISGVQHSNLWSHGWSFWWAAPILKLVRGPTMSHLISITKTLLSLRIFQGFWSSVPGTRDKDQMYSLLYQREHLNFNIHCDFYLNKNTEPVCHYEAQAIPHFSFNFRWLPSPKMFIFNCLIYSRLLNSIFQETGHQSTNTSCSLVLLWGILDSPGNRAHECGLFR